MVVSVVVVVVAVVLGAVVVIVGRSSSRPTAYSDILRNIVIVCFFFGEILLKLHAYGCHLLCTCELEVSGFPKI